MKTLVILFAVFASISAYSIFQNEWEDWKKMNSKVYAFEEEIRRRYIWDTNMKKIIKHNEEAANGLHTYTLGMNKFGDMDESEFKTLILSQVTRQANQAGSCPNTFYASTKAHTSAKTVDWRTKGYVTPVKDQKTCGSCWAFSATGSLEGQHFKATGKLVSLSEQNLMDCSRPQGDNSCEGGLMDNAFEYIRQNGGIDTEESYPYLAMDQTTCNYKEENKGANLTTCTDIDSGNENALREAVEKVGPISVAIDASQFDFHFYKSGVYYSTSCSSTLLDHGVLAVGYGTDNGQDYWLVKNSWGLNWGDKGYIKMSRNRNNNCGIATQASYPDV